MKNLRVIDEIGNKQDIETDHVPRIGERIILIFGRGGAPVKTHYYRVKDVAYHLDQKPDIQAAILIEEETGTVKQWPS
jgi:hypothetical protein